MNIWMSAHKSNNFMQQAKMYFLLLTLVLFSNCSENNSNTNPVHTNTPDAANSNSNGGRAPALSNSSSEWLSLPTDRPIHIRVVNNSRWQQKIQVKYIDAATNKEAIWEKNVEGNAIVDGPEFKVAKKPYQSVPEPVTTNISYSKDNGQTWSAPSVCRTGTTCMFLNPRRDIALLAIQNADTDTDKAQASASVIFWWYKLTPITFAANCPSGDNLCDHLKNIPEAPKE